MNTLIVKRKMLAHLEMTRPYTLCHSGLLAVAGAEVASHGQIALWRVALAALVALCGWEAGLYAGDYFDRDLDAQSKPMRAIPSGRVSPREAWNVMVALILIGYAAALCLGVINLIVAMGTTVLGIAYSKTFKTQALLGNFDRGILGVCAVAFGAAASGSIAWPALFLLMAMVFCHDSSTNLVGAMRDMVGDAAAGYRTVPVVYGMGRAVDIACGLALASEICGGLILARIGPSVLALFFFLGAILIACMAYVPLARAHAHVSRLLALSAHKLLVYERLTLLCAFIALFLPVLVVLLIFAGALVITAISQNLLRDRYENSLPLTGALKRENWKQPIVE
jgi:geranylgeranylglycerol-phosphate geranylgeranyltransferase